MPLQKHILIIEDEEPIVKILADRLSHEGFRVTTARDGKEGASLAFAHTPDLILLDFMMPVMGGISVLKKLSEDEWGRRVPVIVLTNLSDLRTIMEAVEFGHLMAPPLTASAGGELTEQERKATAQFLRDRLKSEVYEYVVKRDWSLKEVVEKIKRKLDH